MPRCPSHLAQGTLCRFCSVLKLFNGLQVLSVYSLISKPITTSGPSNMKKIDCFYLSITIQIFWMKSDQILTFGNPTYKTKLLQIFLTSLLAPCSPLSGLKLPFNPCKIHSKLQLWNVGKSLKLIHLNPPLHYFLLKLNCGKTFPRKVPQTCYKESWKLHLQRREVELPWGSTSRVSSTARSRHGETHLPPHLSLSFTFIFKCKFQVQPLLLLKKPNIDFFF